MLQRETLSILRCPEDGSCLTLAGESLITEINQAIRRGQLRNRGGRMVERAIDNCLVRPEGDAIYPIIDGIPVLVREEAIPLDQLDGGKNGARMAPPNSQ